MYKIKNNFIGQKVVFSGGKAILLTEKTSNKDLEFLYKAKHPAVYINKTENKAKPKKINKKQESIEENHPLDIRGQANSGCLDC